MVRQKILGFERFLPKIRDIEKNCLFTDLQFKKYSSKTFQTASSAEHRKSCVYN